MGIRRKLSLTFAAIIIGGLVLLTLILSVVSREYLDDLHIKVLQQNANSIEEILGYLPQEQFRTELDSLAGTLSSTMRVRVTFMDEQGRVLADSDVDFAHIDTVENHLGRPEVQEARKIGWGVRRGTSATVNQPFLYVATHHIKQKTPVSYVRLAKPLEEIRETVTDLRRLLIMGGVFILAITLGVSWVLSRRITSPLREMAWTARSIAEGNYNARAKVHGRDELAQLAASLNQMAETIENDIKEMRKLERVRTEFIGNTSHELKTPIASIKGYIETLLSGGLEDSEVNVKFLQRASKNAERLQMLVQDLVQISRIESGEMRMSIRVFDILTLLTELYQDYARQFEVTDLNWNLQVPEETEELKVQGDKERLKQVLTNLITNALKYTEEGRVTLGVMEEPERVIVFVEDTGPGIPREYQSRIFERFFRIDKDRSRSVGGTGLGLAIVKHILSAHESQIHLESDGHSGSRFWFPLKRIEEAPYER